MKHRLREARKTQIAGYSLLMLHEPCRDARCGKGRSEIDVETGIDSARTSNGCGALRICHKYHGAHRGNGATADTFADSLRCLLVPPPIVSVDDEQTFASKRREFH